MDLNNIQIKETVADDFNHIMEVEKKAFGYDKEAKLTDQCENPVEEKRLIFALWI
jgi:putative acetyltransferase